MAGHRINQKMKVGQISIGLRNYQIEFIEKNSDFKPSEFIREMIDKQIQIIDPNYWEELNSHSKNGI